jgi:DNA-binding transcriptional LysR family regulator
VDIRLVESADDRELLALVERGEIDVSFCVFPLEGGPFESIELMRDPYVLVVAADSPLAGREKAPTLREILELPLISYRTCRTTARVEERLRVAGREPDVVFRSDDNGTLQALVAAGVGVALVPRLTVDLDDASIAVIELGDRVPPRIIGVAWHADRQLTPAARMFIHAAEAVCRSKEVAAA